MYGGLGQLCAPLSDCWVLRVDGGEGGGGVADWAELELDYDHGEVRCWHTAAVTPELEMVIHSGLTQEYYLTRYRVGVTTVHTAALPRLDLDDHPEDLLHFTFGPRPLARLALEAAVAVAEAGGGLHQLEELPAALRRAVQLRLSEAAVAPDKWPPTETEYSRARLHAGV